MMKIQYLKREMVFMDSELFRVLFYHAKKFNILSHEVQQDTKVK